MKKLFFSLAFCLVVSASFASDDFSSQQDLSVTGCNVIVNLVGFNLTVRSANCNGAISAIDLARAALTQMAEGILSIFDNFIPALE